MTQLYEINVKLSDNQKTNLSKAFHKRETIVLRLTKDALNGSDTLYVPTTTVKRLVKNRTMNKGMDIKLSKTNIRKQVGGSLLTSILTLGKAFGPTLAKTLGLSALAGAASEGASQIVKKISGKGVEQRWGSYTIPNSKIRQLVPHRDLLSKKQKMDILNALENKCGVNIKPTKTQTGGFLGALLASIGIPLALKAITGSGGPRLGKPRKQDGGAALQRYPQTPPPFFGTWKQAGRGKKKSKQPRSKKPRSKQRSGSGLLLGKNSPFNGIPLLGAIL